MNNKRHIRQKNFRDNYNGYQVYDRGIYLTQVNRERVGLNSWAYLDYWSNVSYWGGLTYHIR